MTDPGVVDRVAPERIAVSPAPRASARGGKDLVLRNVDRTVPDPRGDEHEPMSLDPVCRHDRRHDRGHNVLGLLVVARPHPDGRHRAVIAHTTFSLRTPGPGPVPAASGHTPEGF